MSKIKGFIAISAFSLLILGLPAIASAQWNGGYGNGGYGNRGGYGNYNIQGTVRDLKNRAKSFEKATDRYDDGRGRGRNYRSNLEDLADEFRKATDDLEDAYGRGRNMNNSADEARRVLDIGARIDQELYGSRRGGGSVMSQWNSIRRDLDVLANAYGYNNRNNRGGRGRNGGGWRNNFPF